jgi:hypothetical protein
MLKTLVVVFRDEDYNFLWINENQIQSFPLIGGESAEMITTKFWNQHGDTHINAMMDAPEGEFVFIIPTRNMIPEEIAEERRKITNICNPLKGTVKMIVILNDYTLYQRDITFVSAPIFPTGLENRNRDWQKVQLLYTANNPFWYSENEVIETFQGVEPLIKFPITMSTTNPIYFGNIIPSKIARNDGQVEAPVVIEVKGTCQNPKIENETTGEFIAFKDLIMDADDVLVIDTTFGQKKVELNGENIFNKLDFTSTFFNLQIGDNVIDFIDDLNAPDTTISFIYRNLYITI